MNLAAELQLLQQQRDDEFARLRSRITAIGDTLESDFSPAQIVRKHPYATMLSAAAIGFVAAQLPPKSPRQVVPASLPPLPAEPVAGSLKTELLGVLMNLAQQYFLSPRDQESAPASLSISNTGTVDGPAFPCGVAFKLNNGDL